MTLKRPVTLAAARRWPAAAARRESFCARMGGMREKLTSERTARDPRSKINRALAAWDCDEPELLERKHVTKGVRPMKITKKMVGAEARRNPATSSIAPDEIVPASSMKPLNAIEDTTRYERLAQSMRQGGWQGRPILVVKSARGKPRALTGSHRIAAAKVTNTPVPVLYVDQRATKWKDSRGIFTSFNDAIDEQRVPEFLRAAGDYRAATLAEIEDMDRMPMQNPRRKPTVSRKISQLTREGYPQRQAVAIALSEQRAGKVRANPAMAKLYTVHTVTGNGKPRDPIAHFRKRSDALTYAKAYAKAYGAPVVLTSKAL